MLHKLCRYNITVADASWRSWRAALLKQFKQKSGTLTGLLVSDSTRQAFAGDADLATSGTEPSPAAGGVWQQVCLLAVDVAVTVATAVACQPTYSHFQFSVMSLHMWHMLCRWSSCCWWRSNARAEAVVRTVFPRKSPHRRKGSNYCSCGSGFIQAGNRLVSQTSCQDTKTVEARVVAQHTTQAGNTDD